jgi:hypothetical protein
MLSILSIYYTVKPVLRGHLWDKASVLQPLLHGRTSFVNMLLEDCLVGSYYSQNCQWGHIY